MDSLKTCLEDNAELITEHSGWMRAIFSAIAIMSEQPETPAIKYDINRLAGLGEYLADKTHGFGAAVATNATGGAA